MFYYTYVLLCKDKNRKEEFYIGHCEDLVIRIKRHKAKLIFTTKKFDSVELVYYEACKNKTDAVKREAQLKTGFGRGYIKKRLHTYLSKGRMLLTKRD